MGRNNVAAVSSAVSTQDLFALEALEAPPSTKRFAARELADALAAMKVDDEPTLDVPAPIVPAGTPSPLGDDDCEAVASGERPTLRPSILHEALDETLTLSDLGVDPDDDFPHLPALSSGEKRNKPRQEPVGEQDVRRLVVAIWTIAIAMAALLTYVVVSDESARALRAAPSDTSSSR